ncbi:GNAT family N-acetyltransferase [Candidatus Bathyarchaeota archaeon]|nr:GNAT family N-acetyltransferase [Candidatus Bathyarchaeota archaeon]
MKDLRVRPLEKRDVSEVKDIYTLSGWSVTEGGVESWLLGGGYIKTYVAELDGRIVGKVGLDTAFPPYAEIINIVVHPDYQGKGVGSRLMEYCMQEAERRGFWTVYLMCDPLDVGVHRFYSRFGFKPAILGDREDPRESTWLFRFGRGSFIDRFLHDHPLSEFQVSEHRVDFRGRRLYRMRWMDPVTEDYLELFLEGQPGQPDHGTMPRVSGFKLRLGDMAAEALAKEKSCTISYDEPGGFIFEFENRSDDEATLTLKPLTAPGVDIKPRPPRRLKVEAHEKMTLEFSTRLSDFFRIPVIYLSFQTVVSSLIVSVNGLNGLVSAGWKFQP